VRGRPAVAERGGVLHRLQLRGLPHRRSHFRFASVTL